MLIFSLALLSFTLSMYIPALCHMFVIQWPHIPILEHKFNNVETRRHFKHNKLQSSADFLSLIFLYHPITYCWYNMKTQKRICILYRYNMIVRKYSNHTLCIEQNIYQSNLHMGQTMHIRYQPICPYIFSPWIPVVNPNIFDSRLSSLIILCYLYNNKKKLRHSRSSPERKTPPHNHC